MEEGFRNVAQADSFRSALLTATRKDGAFSLATGRPVVREREEGDLRAGPSAQVVPANGARLSGG